MIVFRVQLNQGEGRGRTLSCSVSNESFLKHKDYNFSLRCIRCLYYYMYPLRGNQDPAPRLEYCSLTVSLLSLHLLPSLISNCLNLPLGTQGRPWRLNEAHFLRIRNGGHRKAFASRNPAGPCLVSLLAGLGILPLLLKSLLARTAEPCCR